MARRAGLVVVAVLALAGAPRALATPVPLGPCGPIARPDDAVELPAIRLRHLHGAAIPTLGVVAFRGGVAAPIPFQVDERTGKKLALPGGPEPHPDDSPDVLDDQDLLVFMACDVGEEATSDELTRLLADAAPVTAWREVRVDDPGTGRTGYVYVVTGPHPPHTERHYVEYDPAVDLVTTARYRIGCVGALPVYFGLALDGPLWPNVLDGLRLRAEARLLAGLVRWTLNERQGRHKLIAWKAGPVRVVRRSRHEVDIGLGLHLTAGVAHTYFYAQHVFGPGAMKLPFSPAFFFHDITAWGGADFRDLRGWRFRAPGVPPGDFAIDGISDAAETRYAADGNWLLLHRQGQALLIVASVSPNFTQFVRLQPSYVDDATLAKPPEDVVGSVPFAGFRMLGLQKIAAGRYRFQLWVVALPGYRDGDERRVLRQLDVSLTADVTVRAVPAATPAAAP
jgi:hypothetical protein